VSTLLSEFHHRAPAARPDRTSRAVAGLLTAVLYALFALLAWWALMGPPARPARELVATLLPTQKKRVAEPPPLPHLLRPRADQLAVPAFTIAPDTPPPAPLAATAAQTSPIAGGGAGNGAGGGGNGAGSGGCLDPLWMRAVTERVRQAFYYPDAALAARITGVVTLRFAVRRDGQIDRLEIGKSSGDAGLDKAALDIMRKAQPLPPIPERMHAERVEGELPINFGVRGFQSGSSAGHC
jgi:protein TonB